MKLRLKQDLVIPTGTVFAPTDWPVQATWNPDVVTVGVFAYGANADGTLYAGVEATDAEMFETVEDQPPSKRRAARS